MKLELKHLAPYLPYDIRYKDSYAQDVSDYKLDTNALCNFEKGHIRLLIPMLRPLSDITKEIKHYGEKFVPMVNIAKMDTDCAGVEFEINEFGICIGRLNAGVTVVFQIDDEIPFIKEIHNNIFDQVSGNDFDDMHISSVMPSEIREKLIEWHFDVYGLIPAGIAIERE